ncbi:MAG: shikimate dehydrogenase, partial [Nanoarchaeota archaeon]
ANLLEKMGCKVLVEEDRVILEGTAQLKAIEVNMKDMPDVVQTLCVVAACAEGTTKITGIGHLKYKECDRLEKTAQELSKAGIKVTVTDDELHIVGNRELNAAMIEPKAAVIETHNDHRMAMSMALLGLKKAGIKIQNPEVVKKSFPEYWKKLSELGAKIICTDNIENIILIGYRGAGKTSVAEILARKLSKKMVSTDAEIAKHIGEGYKGDISAFVQANGWKKFREIECSIVNSLQMENGIIDCGGGVVEEEKNIAELKKRGKIVWLKANASAIKERIKDSNRPALTQRSSAEEVEEVLERREPLYKKSSDIEINSDNKTPEQIAEEIITLLGLKPRLCIPIVAETVEEAKRDLAEAERHADLVEWRMDHHKNLSEQGSIERMMEVIAARTKPIIATCRGELPGKKILLLKAVESGAEFIDLDENQKDIIEEIRKGKTRIILSFHDSLRTPSLEELNRKYDEMQKHRPDFIKIVTTANSINDNFTIFSFLQGKKNCLAFCMGARGTLSRILAPKYGSFLTFAALDDKKISAPGQLPLIEMEKYDVTNINERTEIYGVVGTATEHSLSPQIQNYFFHHSSENARFLPFKVEEKELGEFVQNMRKYNFQGAAITMPHKVMVMQYLDEVDEIAACIGAVNTIVNKKGKFIGYNTDCYGALRALHEESEIKGKKVLLLGAGGAARAIVYGLQKEEAKVTISNRTPEKAKRLAEEFNADHLSLAEAEKESAGYDIIINATSAGMGSQQEEIPLHTLPKEKIVMDIVSRPAITKFIKLGQQNDCTLITGEKMLLYQAAQQYYLWRNKELNSEVLEHARQLFW